MNSNYAKENISTKQSPSRQEARLQSKNGDQERTRRIETPSCQRSQSINGQTLLNFRLPKAGRLLKRREFLKVYAEGKRFESRLITAFILPSESLEHRAGFTATKKGVGKAHERNRAKRLLRETFRLSKVELSGLKGTYDWVLNARRGLLAVKLEKPLQDFQKIIAAIKNSESEKGKENVTD